jgi:hypothetical protein
MANQRFAPEQQNPNPERVVDIDRRDSAMRRRAASARQPVAASPIRSATAAFAR